MQDCVNSNKIKENKYKILRMSLLLGSSVDREDTFNNFEDAAREIDAMNDEVYLKNIEDKFYDTLKLEDEEEKLTVLVDYIGGRVEQRISLLSDFANVTGYDLQDLSPIKYYDKLDDYKERLSYIREYLSNTEQIEKLNDEIEKDDNRLNEAYLNKAASEEHNQKIEDTLLDKFVALFKSLDFFKEINEDNLEEKINEVVYNVQESKKSLDIFTKSFNALSGSGISIEEEKEYFSYVENAKCAYYTYKEQEYILRLYKLLLFKYTDYGQILYKREEINDILYERLKLRKELSISGSDLFSNIYDLLERQYDDIKRQSVDIDNIEKLTVIINEKRDEVNRLEIENQKVEILSILREFGVIDTYNDIANSVDEVVGSDNSIDDINSIDITTSVDEVSDNSIDDDTIEDKELDSESYDELVEDSSEIIPEVEEDVVVDTEEVNLDDSKDIFDEEALDNEVILVEDAVGVDLELINSKASKVMKRVGEMLGIKVDDTKIVSVSNEEEKNIFMNEEVSENDNSNQVDIIKQNQGKEQEVLENPLFNSEVKEDNSINPLFSSEVSDMENTIENPLFSNDGALGNSTLDNFSLPNNVDGDFWFPSDTPDALNELPDLNVSNDDFFANNNVADLEFPDLDINFPDNDMEGKI